MSGKLFTAPLGENAWQNNQTSCVPFASQRSVETMKPNAHLQSKRAMVRWYKLSSRRVN